MAACTVSIRITNQRITLWAHCMAETKMQRKIDICILVIMHINRMPSSESFLRSLTVYNAFLHIEQQKFFITSLLTNKTTNHFPYYSSFITLNSLHLIEFIIYNLFRILYNYFLFLVTPSHLVCFSLSQTRNQCLNGNFYQRSMCYSVIN